MMESDYIIGVYVRESRDDNEENYETIETQRDLLINYINKNKTGRIHRVYIDDNVSGSAFERKGLNKLKEDVMSGTINMLVLKDLSRLGRSNAKTLMFLDFLEEYGVRVITYDGRYDSVKDNDTVGIDSWFNERYVRDISKKIRASMRFKIERGEYIGSAPYGYTKSQTEKNRLCIEPIEANIVKQIFGLYREGYGYAHIAKHLNSKNYPPPSSVGIWSPISVKRIICNDVYIGHTVQGISEKVSFKSKKTRRLPPEKWVITNNTHEAIIKKEEFEEVQKMRNKRSIGTGSHKGTIHVFKELLYCGKCNNALFARIRKNKPLGYICSTYMKKGTSMCSSHYIREDFLKSAIYEDIINLLKDENIRKQLVSKLREGESGETGKGEEKQHLEQVLTNKLKQQDILYMDKLEGKITEQLFIRINSSIEGRICHIRHELKRINSIMEKEVDYNDMIIKFIDSIMQEGLTNEMIKLIVKRIIIFDKNEYNDMHKCIDKVEEGEIPEGLVVIEYKY